MEDAAYYQGSFAEAQEGEDQEQYEYTDVYQGQPAEANEAETAAYHQGEPVTTGEYEDGKQSSPPV